MSSTQAARSPWQNRIVGHGEVYVRDIILNKKNWRTHPTIQQETLEALIDEIGFIKSITINKTTGNLVDGHLRVLLADRRGEEKLPAEYVELTQEQEDKALALLDPLAALAGADTEKLNALLHEITTPDPALQQMLSDLASMHGLYKEADEQSTVTGHQEKPAATNYLKFADYKIPLTEMELDALCARVESHVQQTGQNYGFVNSLLGLAE